MCPLLSSQYTIYRFIFNQIDLLLQIMRESTRTSTRPQSINKCSIVKQLIIVSSSDCLLILLGIRFPPAQNSLNVSRHFTAASVNTTFFVYLCNKVVHISYKILHTSRCMLLIFFSLLSLFLCATVYRTTTHVRASCSCLCVLFFSLSLFNQIMTSNTKIHILFAQRSNCLSL